MTTRNRPSFWERQLDKFGCFVFVLMFCCGVLTFIQICFPSPDLTPEERAKRDSLWHEAAFDAPIDFGI